MQKLSDGAQDVKIRMVSNKIFEGDICNFSNRSDIDNYGIVVYNADETEFGIVYDSIYAGLGYTGLGRHYTYREIEVVGKIYDSPELLKE